MYQYCDPGWINFFSIWSLGDIHSSLTVGKSCGVAPLLREGGCSQNCSHFQLLGFSGMLSPRSNTALKHNGCYLVRGAPAQLTRTITSNDQLATTLLVWQCFSPDVRNDKGELFEPGNLSSNQARSRATANRTPHSHSLRTLHLFHVKSLLIFNTNRDLQYWRHSAPRVLDVGEAFPSAEYSRPISGTVPGSSAC